MQRIELDDLTAERLNAQAVALGLTVDEYLRSIIAPSANGHSGVISQDELDAELDALILDLPTLPSDFSRDDIYNEHD
jgi:hypothetical protein